jgi:protein-tyrosine phosphatase
VTPTTRGVPGRQVDRRITLDGAHNLRDLGGYPTRDGGRTRWRLVYRADGLQNLSEGDVARFEALGISAVFDLRSDAERVARPNRVESIPWCVMTPVEDAGVAVVDREGMLDAVAGERHLRTIYSNLLTYSALMFGGLFRAMAEPGGVPMLFHCHAGKDRTGLVAALLLDALGVPRDVVLDDYELTASYRLREHQQDSYENLIATGMAPAAAAGVLGAPRWAMAETLEQLDDELGGVDRYLTERGGLDADTLTRLRDLLVEH